jgi:DNA mismatch repair ATPase MutS
VLAESATMSIRRGFFSHFSSAEEEFLKGDARGRFDQEAREIAAILDKLTPYSLLLLNETFQTTSYKEGTKSIYDILRFMPKLKTKYVFVTHLTALFGYMESEKVILAHTSDDPSNKYKIIVEK